MFAFLVITYVFIIGDRETKSNCLFSFPSFFSTELSFFLPFSSSLTSKNVFIEIRETQSSLYLSR